MFLKIIWNSQENICAGVYESCRLPAFLLKNRLLHRCFFMNFVKFLRTSFLCPMPVWVNFDYPVLKIYSNEKVFPIRLFFFHNLRFSSNKHRKAWNTLGSLISIPSLAYSFSKVFPIPSPLLFLGPHLLSFLLCEYNS